MTRRTFTQALVLAALAASCGLAGTIYTYTGPAYTVCTGSYASGGNCAGTYSLTGTFDTSLTLAQLENGGSGLTGYTIPNPDIRSISFSDGVLASLNQSTAATEVVEISTNGSGDITSWGIYLSVETPTANNTVTGETIATYGTPIGPINADVSGNLVSTICGSVPNPPNGCNYSLPSGGDDVVAGLTESAGSWSGPVTTPEPSSALLLGMGLLALVILDRCANRARAFLSSRSSRSR